MPFVFSCSECGQVLYEDSSPIPNANNHRITYLERVLEKIGPNCPSCGHKLHIPPATIEIKLWNGHNGNGKQKK